MDESDPAIPNHEPQTHHSYHVPLILGALKPKQRSFSGFTNFCSFACAGDDVPNRWHHRALLHARLFEATCGPTSISPSVCGFQCCFDKRKWLDGRL